MTSTCPVWSSWPNNTKPGESFFSPSMRTPLIHEDEVAAHARQFGVEFPVLKDPGNKVADLLLRNRLAKRLVVDGKAVLRYRGAIDDQYDLGKRKDKATHSYLVDAIDRS